MQEFPSGEWLLVRSHDKLRLVNKRERLRQRMSILAGVAGGILLGLTLARWIP